MENRIAVYGAYGHTGKFIVSRLCECGYHPILCGRNPEKLGELYRKYPSLQMTEVDIDQPDRLDEAFSDARMIVNCAGPFLDTAEPIIRSALRLKKHYIDLSAEQRSVQDTFESFSEEAKVGGVVIMPGAAFYGGLADLLGTAATVDREAVDDISVYIGLDSWHPTEGTRLTGQRNHYPRVVWVNKQLVPLKESPLLTWTFPEPVGSKLMLAVPLSEIITISRHIPVENISTYISKNAIDDIRSAETPEPKPTAHKNRSSQVFFMEVVAKQGGFTKRIIATGNDIYATTAPLVVEAVKRIVEGRVEKIGVTTMGEAFDAVDFLQSLDKDDIRFSFS